jgi:hypothetical protein
MCRQRVENTRHLLRWEKKLDPEFVAAQGDQLYEISDGMSVLFKTADNEYGRLFFYRFVNKGTQTNKAAPSADELLKE